MRHLGIVLLALASTASFSAAPPPAVSLQVLGTYRTGVFEKGAAEIVAYDPLTKRVFVVNAAATSVDVLDVSDPTNPTKFATIDAAALGDSANSVAVKNGLVAVAIQADVKTDPGLIAVYDSSTLALLRTFPAGALPDMVAFSPAGDSILVANEGEPNDAYTIDPEGSLTLVDLAHGLDAAQVWQIDFHKFDSRRAKLLEKGVRLFGPNATVSQDLEPEYVTFSWDGHTAWVTLQENNALAKVDLVQGEVLQILPLGSKDHGLAGNALRSERSRRRHPHRQLAGIRYLSTRLHRQLLHQRRDLSRHRERRRHAWLGGLRRGSPRQGPQARRGRIPDWRRPAQGSRRSAGSPSRRPWATPTATATTTHSTCSVRGHSRSGIPTGNSCSTAAATIEDLVASVAAPDFNSDHAANASFDTRSDNKGPEPEGIAVGEIGGRVYAFIGLERQSGILVYDVTKPKAPVFQDYLGNRNFLVPTKLADGSSNPAAGDLGPEGLAFIEASQSPNGKPLLVVGNEISGTTTIYEVVVN